MNEEIARIKQRTILIDGNEQAANIIIKNSEGKWYGVNLGGGDWDYLQDNGDYIPVPEKKRTTIYIDAATLKAAKIKAMQEDTNLSAVIEKLLKEYAKPE